MSYNYEENNEINKLYQTIKDDLNFILNLHYKILDNYLLKKQNEETENENKNIHLKEVRRTLESLKTLLKITYELKSTKSSDMLISISNMIDFYIPYFKTLSSSIGEKEFDLTILLKTTEEYKKIVGYFEDDLKELKEIFNKHEELDLLSEFNSVTDILKGRRSI